MPAAPSQLDGRLHTPSVGPDGTLICSCGGARYSPSAYVKHLAGEPMRDALKGVYVTLDDSWKPAPPPTPPSAQPDRGDVHTDAAGNTWQPFLNEYQQRQLRCVAGARAGDIVHAPTYALPPDDQPRRAMADGVEDSPFFD